jgi:hypothetical protein
MNQARIALSGFAASLEPAGSGLGGGFLTTDFTDFKGFHGWGKAAGASNLSRKTRG